MLAYRWPYKFCKSNCLKIMIDLSQIMIDLPQNYVWFASKLWLICGTEKQLPNLKMINLLYSNKQTLSFIHDHTRLISTLRKGKMYANSKLRVSYEGVVNGRWHSCRQNDWHITNLSYLRKNVVWRSDNS